ncbi:MAG: hypothetical protein ACYTXY_42485, partial [Nostoc sp.]
SKSRTITAASAFDTPNVDRAINVAPIVAIDKFFITVEIAIQYISPKNWYLIVGILPTKYVSKNIGEIPHNASSATVEVSASRGAAMSTTGYAYADINTSEHD